MQRLINSRKCIKFAIVDQQIMPNKQKRPTWRCFWSKSHIRLL
uniref:Uncharacterized protein n=1 Tax=Rhizophora mucronata TaxID=61149 RepID=A0A2P2LAK9_RHIMU